MYCEFEGKEFSDEEFEQTAVHGWVHKASPAHTTLGDLIDSGEYEHDGFEEAEEE